MASLAIRSKDVPGERTPSARSGTDAPRPRWLSWAITIVLATAPAATAAPAVFQVQGLSQFGPAHVAVAFTDSVDAAAAIDPSHYTLTPQGGAPPLGVQGAKVLPNQRTVVLATASRLPQNAAYAITVTNLSSRQGTPLTSGGPGSFTTVGEALLGIDEVQAGVGALLGQNVSVVGQVFIRASTAGTGAPSAYIEDGTGRGINVLGTLGGPVATALDTLTLVAKVTGTVAQSFTTVQLTSFTATAIASGMAELAARPMTVPQASATQWEGTYIRTTGRLTAAPSAHGANDYRYPATGDGTAFTFRVRNAAGINPAGFASGDTVTGAGAGGAYPFRYQIAVGNFSDLVRGSASPDLDPPSLFSATAVAARDSVTLVFSEVVGNGSGAIANYQVFPTTDPGSPITVISAAPNGAVVVLRFVSALEGGRAYTARAGDVADLAGNLPAAATSIEFIPVVPDVESPVLVSASGTGGQTRVTLTFSEAVFTGASLPSNYEVYPSASPGTPVAVTTATPNAEHVELVLAAPLTGGLDYTVRVNGVRDLAGNPVAANSVASFNAVVPSGFVVTGAFQFGKAYVGVGFAKLVNVAQATDPAHYEFTPPLPIAAIAIQDNGQTAIVRSTSPLPASTAYSLRVTGISSADGEPLAGTDPVTFQTVAGTVTDLAEIQNNVSTYKHQTVTVVGQVFITVGSRGGTPSGYIQDGSGRGINLFGGSAQAPVNALGNVAKVTGVVDTFNTTIEITPYSATLVASGQPHLGARVLSVREANSSAWEGTYIQTTATLTDPPVASGTSNYNYFAADGGAAITFRVGNGLGIDPGGFTTGDRITGRGAGGSFQSTFQINVGSAVDLFKIQAGPPSTETRLTVEAATLIKNLGRISVQIAAPTGSTAVCRVFDLQGRLVKVLFDGRLVGTETVSWDGRDDTFEFVPAGMYVCHLQTTDGVGNVHEDRAPIVVAVRLR